jgi:hypothetical protein
VLPVAVIVGFQNKTLPISVDGTVKVVAARLFAWGALSLLQDEVRTLKTRSPQFVACPDRLQTYATLQ